MMEITDEQIVETLKPLAMEIGGLELVERVIAVEHVKRILQNQVRNFAEAYVHMETPVPEMVRRIMREERFGAPEEYGVSPLTAVHNDEIQIELPPRTERNPL